MENLKKAEDLLKKLGFKGSLFVAPKEEDHEESSTVEEDEKESRAAWVCSLISRSTLTNYYAMVLHSVILTKLANFIAMEEVSFCAGQMFV